MLELLKKVFIYWRHLAQKSIRHRERERQRAENRRQRLAAKYFYMWRDAHRELQLREPVRFYFMKLVRLRLPD